MSDAELDGQAGLEKLVVRRPHKWIVDNRRSLQHGVFEVGTIIRHFMGDAVDDDGIRTGSSMRVPPSLMYLGRDAHLAPPYFVQERRRNGFAPHRKADLNVIPAACGIAALFTCPNNCREACQPVEGVFYHLAPAALYSSEGQMLSIVSSISAQIFFRPLMDQGRFRRHRTGAFTQQARGFRCSALTCFRRLHPVPNGPAWRQWH